MSSYTFDLEEPWDRWKEQLERLARELEDGARMRPAELAGAETGLFWRALSIADQDDALLACGISSTR